ncbi:MULTISPECIES: peptidase U32 family protein [Desulfosediminicola]|uniref:peptidase U32 family protein n=1 Tax=Desulfosediminicola TaxID=2886823 RepID=UPI0010AC72B6|nr:peptidase U32 family protein [Desulfosediminicola ganghwensis]
MELLAPAGNVENFYAALEAGADAVYVGAPGINARNLARDLSLEEIGAMIAHCRRHDKKIYVAANSMILEKELTEVIETLGVLEYLAPDGLIVQDLGIINLVRRYFPELQIHASTLMAAHNLQSVELLARMGCSRVVLARELTLAEIEAIARRTDVELEVFVHGAMCFSYSGYCLFSSYLGGKSGLRGRCVQPCRRSYGTNSGQRSGARGGSRPDSHRGKGSYLFSMNDLDGLEVVKDLRELGVASVKIEGRLRSALYVEKVVRAYRKVMDAPESSYKEALGEAKILVDQAMSRKVSSGYFFTPQPAEAITPHHSGNMGLHLGRARGAARQGMLRVELKEGLAVGDRVRLHLEPSGERLAFSLRKLFLRGAEVDYVAAGENADLLLPEKAFDKSWKHIDLYKVDVGKGGGYGTKLAVADAAHEIGRARKKLLPHLISVKERVYDTAHDPAFASKEPLKQPPRKKQQQKGKRQNHGETVKVKLPMDWWLKLDSAKPILASMVLRPDKYIITLDKNSVRDAGQLKRLLGKQSKSVTWALPPIMLDRELSRMKKHISMLIRSGFRCFQVSHVSQIDLFDGEKVFLTADHSLNLLNNQALLFAAEAGFESVQLAMEADRESIQNAVQGYKQMGVPASRKTGGRRTMRLGMTVYGAPPLFTARLAASFFQYNKPVISPKQEGFVISKKDGFTQTRPARPFSLLPYLYDLKSMGIDFAVVDLTGGLSGKKDLQDLAERMSGNARKPKLPTFNYMGTLE